MLTRNTKIICGALLFTQIIIAHFILPAFNRQDFYPFYTWDLFSFTPEIQKLYFVRVHKLDGKVIDPPEQVLFHRDHYPARYKKALPIQIMRLGYFLENPQDNEERIRRYTRIMERNLFTEHVSAEYDMNYAIVNIRETLKSREIKDFTSLSRFEFNRIEGDE